MAKIRLTFPRLLSDDQVTLLRCGIERIVADLFLGRRGSVSSEVHLQEGASSVFVKVSDGRHTSSQILTGKMEFRIRSLCALFVEPPVIVRFVPLG